MTAIAKLNREYALRMLGVGALMFGLAGWSLYDGLAGYPRLNACYAEIRPDLVGLAMTAGELTKPSGEDGVSVYERAFQNKGLKAPHAMLAKLKALNEQARSQQAPEGQADRFRAQQVEAARLVLDKPARSRHEIQSQFVMVVLAGLAGLAACAAVGFKARRRFIADDAGLRGFAADVIAYDAVASADWRQWDDKRIIRLILRDGRRLKLDGWHFSGAEGVVEELVRRRPELKLIQNGVVA
jgi:hypothetical protein